MKPMLSVLPGPNRGAAGASTAYAATILIVNDHPLIRQAVAEILGGIAGRMHVLQAETVASALAELAAHPDTSLVLLDPALRDGDGVSGFDRLRAEHAAVRVAALCAPSGRAEVLAVLARGAMGFIPDRSPPGVLLNAVRLVLAGQVYLPPEVLRGGDAPPPVAAPPRRDGPSLTPRQLQVLSLLVQGIPNKLICRSLVMAEGTLKTHVATIYRELGVSNRAQAGFAARQIRLRLPGAGAETMEPA
ncbi:MAG TPA: response regulator transcription factor [Burkholderiales bacterium]|nr:response regulator transcription factor [Burkholderiales bacterium]